MKKKFYLDRTIRAVDGFQTWSVEAESLEEAFELFNKGEGEFEFEEIQVMDIDDVDINSIYEE